MRLRHTYYLGTLRVEIIQKLSLKIIQKLLLGGAPVAHPFWGVALRARNLSKSIQNQTKSICFAWKLFKIIFKIIQKLILTAETPPLLSPARGGELISCELDGWGCWWENILLLLLLLLILLLLLLFLLFHKDEAAHGLEGDFGAALFVDFQGGEVGLGECIF